MHIYKSLIAVCAVILLGLSACGGGGGPATTPDPKPDPMPPVAAPADCEDKACVDHYKGLMDTAQTALNAAKKDQNSTQAQIAAAQKAYDDAMKAHGDAVTALATYVAMQPPMYNLKAMAAKIGTPSTLPVTVSDGTGSAIAGGKVTVNDSDGNNTWTEATWPVAKITDWAESVWKKSDDSIVVYTTIEADKGAKYNAYYPVDPGSTRPSDATNAAPAGWSYTAWVGVASVAQQTKDDGQGNQVADTSKPNVITLATTVDAKASKLYSASMLPSGNGISKKYPDGDKATIGDQVEFDGMFNGVAGKFECTNADVSAGCVAVNDAKGALASLTGTWTFTADDKDATVAKVLMDADYLDFGYWVNTDDSGDDTVYKINTFARGATVSGSVASVEGSAKYVGGAAGLYIKRAHAPGGDGDITAAGRFTADAELTAYFGGSSVSSDDEDKVSGTIKNFMDGDQVIDAGWLVELKKASIATGTGAIADGKTTSLGDGSWSGQLYGTISTTTPLPSGIAGKFDATFNNGSVMGAFGATKTKK